MDVTMPKQLYEFGLCRIHGELLEDALRSQQVLVGYSAKNTSFNKAWFRKLLSLQDRLASTIRVIIVDLPYSYNLAAECGRSEPTEKELEATARIGDERESMVRKAIAGSKIDICRWESYSLLPKVTELREELERGLAINNSLARTLVDYTEAWLQTRIPNRNYLNFLIQEIPVFAYLYWVEGFNIDIYPGPPLRLFIDIQNERYGSDLPTYTKMSLSSPVCFVDTSTNSRLV